MWGQTVEVVPVSGRWQLPVCPWAQGREGGVSRGLPPCCSRMSETCSSWGESCQTLINALLIWRNGGTEKVRIHTSTSDTTQVAGQWCAAGVWLSPAALLDAEWGHREQTEVTGNMHCPIDGTRPGPGCVCLRLFESFPHCAFFLGRGRLCSRRVMALGECSGFLEAPVVPSMVRAR